MSVVYEVRFTLSDELKKNNNSLSSKVNSSTAEENQNISKKAEAQVQKEQHENYKKIAGGLTAGLTVATKGYQTYLQVRNVLNAQSMVNMGIRGDILAAKNLQIQTARNDAIIGKISTVLSPALTGAIGGFSGGGLHGAGIGFVAGLGVGVFNLAKDLIVENINMQAQQSAYAADQQLRTYIGTIERQRLINNVGYYRW